MLKKGCLQEILHFIILESSCTSPKPTHCFVFVRYEGLKDISDIFARCFTSLHDILFCMKRFETIHYDKRDTFCQRDQKQMDHMRSKVGQSTIMALIFLRRSEKLKIMSTFAQYICQFSNLGQVQIFEINI